MDPNLLLKVLNYPRLARQGRSGRPDMEIEMQHFILYNFCRRKIRFRDAAGIIPEPSSYVSGVLVTGLKDHDIKKLDFYMGPPFERRKVIGKSPFNVRLEDETPNWMLASLPGEMKEVETHVCKFPAILEDEDWGKRLCMMERSDDSWSNMSLADMQPGVEGARGGSQASGSQGGSGGQGPGTSGSRPPLGPSARRRPAPRPDTSGGRGSTGASAGRPPAAGRGTTGGRGPSPDVRGGWRPASSDDSFGGGW